MTVTQTGNAIVCLERGMSSSTQSPTIVTVSPARENSIITKAATGEEESGRRFRPNNRPARAQKTRMASRVEITDCQAVFLFKWNLLS